MFRGEGRTLSCSGVKGGLSHAKVSCLLIPTSSGKGQTSNLVFSKLSEFFP